MSSMCIYLQWRDTTVVTVIKKNNNNPGLAPIFVTCDMVQLKSKFTPRGGCLRLLRLLRLHRLLSATACNLEGIEGKWLRLVVSAIEALGPSERAGESSDEEGAAPKSHQ